MKKLILISIFCLFILSLNSQDVYIYNSTTWTTNQTIEGNLYIWNGVELQINSGVTIDFVGSSSNKIVIRPDAKLIAEGVNFESSTGLWHGITMYGLGSQYPQIGTPAQPKVILSQCTIKNAQIGISNYYSHPYNNTGGWISLSQCVIKGFTIAGVWFSNYRYQDQNGNYVNDRSRIMETEFNSGSLTYTIGIYMYKVNNVRIQGCRFINPTGKASYYTGIHIVMSSARIVDWQSYYPPSQVRNEFHDCYKGVYISNGYNPLCKVVIENCLFDYNSNVNVERVAIQAIAANNLEILSNEISLRMCCNGQPPNPCLPNQFGIHLNGCTGFHVENNHISVKSNIGPLDHTYAIVVVNSGGQSNELYRNTIDGCQYGIQALNKNRGLEFPYEPNDDGLRFFCNTFLSNISDDYFALIAEVEPAGLTDPTYGVARMQGGSMDGYPTSPAFNDIDRPNPLPVGSENDFFNNHQSPQSINLTDVVYMEPKDEQGITWYYIEYYTGNQNNFGIPNHVFPVQHHDITANEDEFPRCESRLPVIFPYYGDIIAAIQEADDDLQLASGDFLAYANDGDHNYMLTVANNIDASNYIFAYADFMTKNPSHDVLAIMAANEYMPAAFVADILLQNTYGIKYNHVRDALDNRTDQLSQASIDDIFLASEELSQYEVYQMNVSYFGNKLRKLKNLLFDYYHTADTNFVDFNGIIQHLDSDEDFQSKFALLMYYYDIQDQSNVDNYKQIVEQATSDSYEIGFALLLFDLLDIIYFNYEGDYSELTQEDIDNLLYLSQQGTTVASSVALSLLEAYLDYSFSLLAADLTSPSPRIGNFPEESTITDHTVYPNPATSTVMISLPEEVEGAKVLILDMAGRTVWSQSLTEATTALDVSQLVNGVYIIRILGKTKPIGTEKLIINK